ncbi:MAG: VanZ family protein [Chitinivibrionia bacterium]|nr:VanZ family protein [Chitinivibrionia bacterium]
MNKNLLKKIPSLAVMITIFTLSAIPGDEPFLNVFNFSDKIKHFAIYFILGLTFCLWISNEKWLAKPFFFGSLIVVLCAIFGIFDEFHQSFVPNRSGNDLGDLAADILGGFLSPFAYILIIKIRKFAAKN